MSQTVTKIKSRIKSVSGAYKVTSAMKLVSTVKLKQWKNKMIANKTYLLQVEEIVANLLAYSKKTSSPYMNINEKATKDLYVVVCSSLGLCGSYNNNIYKIADKKITNNDDVIILGNKGIVHYKNATFKILDEFLEESVDSPSSSRKIAKYILSEYQKQTYKNVYILYTEYKNSLAFIAKEFKLLPLENSSDINPDIGYGPILEPSPEALVEKIIPFYLENIIYSKLLESAVCEQGARSNAMENATNNAQELLEELNIEFNKARQSAITQEIIEIVAASKDV